MTKAKELTSFTFVNDKGYPIYSARIGVSKATLKNIIDEFKYKYDLKVVNVEHCVTFVKYLKGAGVEVDDASQVIEWK